MTGPRETDGGGRPTVLIVDDVEDNRILLDRILKSGGYATIQAASGREALSLISQTPPAIVLLDWMMPELSGLDTLRAIRELHPKERMPVIMCTAMDEDMAIVTALNAGANDYVVKPISGPVLRARMKAHLDQCAAIDQLDHERSEAERRLRDQAKSMFAAFGGGPNEGTTR